MLKKISLSFLVLERIQRMGYDHSLFFFRGFAGAASEVQP